MQYPWRFNIVLCLAAVPIGAFCLTEVLRLSWQRRSIKLGLVSLVVVTWFISYGEVWKHYMTDVALPRLSVSSRLLVNEDDGWFESWSVRGLSQASTLTASAGPHVRFLGAASGTADVQTWKARHIEFQTEPNRRTGDGKSVLLSRLDCFAGRYHPTKAVRHRVRQ